MSASPSPEDIISFALKPENQSAFADVLTKVLPHYAQYGWGQKSPYKTHFEEWQRAGFSLYPNHYYSPVPDLTRLTSEQIGGRRTMQGLDFDSAAMANLANSFQERFGTEYAGFDRSPEGAGTEFFFGNGVFERVDAEVLHSMVRHHRPKRIIEIGSGYSSLITAAAMELNRQEGNPGDFTLIEPYPNDLFIQSIPGISQLLRQGVEQCPIEMFEELEPGDILFIDSTHVIRAGNDVEYEYFEIIPRLKPGVIIHIHDIFIPARYPESWIKEERIFWNEQYLVEAMLMHNPSFTTLWAGCFMHLNHPHVLQTAFPGYDPAKILPGSIWIQLSGG